MKSFYPCLLLITITAFSCQKDKGTPNVSTSPGTVKTVVVKPLTANFRIINSDSDNNVYEGKIMNFENSSQNGESYLWDFGNGTISAEKIPTGISLWPCTSTVTVTLTVTGKDGKIATYSQPYYVICARFDGGTHVDHPKNP